MAAGIKWHRAASGGLISACGRFEVWQTTSADGSDTWNARAGDTKKYNLGYLATAKKWCESVLAMVLPGSQADFDNAIAIHGNLAAAAKHYGFTKSEFAARMADWIERH